MQTHHTSEEMVVHCMMNCSALWESESYSVWKRFKTNPSSHLFKRNRSPPQREGKIPTNSGKGLWQTRHTHTHIHTQKKTVMNCSGKIPAVRILQRQKPAKLFKADPHNTQRGLRFPPVKRIRANESTGKSFRHFIKISSHKATGKPSDPRPFGRRVLWTAIKKLDA